MGNGRKIPKDDAFAYWVSLGVERSYAAVGRRYNATRRAVQKASDREQWVARLEALEVAAQEETADILKETLVEMRSRHLKTLRAVHGRAVEALRDHRLDTAMDAVRALDISIKLERLIAGEASTRADLIVRELRRREEDQLLVNDADAEFFEDDDDTDDDELDGDVSLGAIIEATGGAREA